jgi:CMP-N,N'-diacetyllegionaminic acid synthase
MTDKPYILGMINARGGSKGVPNKNIKYLGGKPLIGWSIDVARQVPEITRLIVSTEDEEIAQIAAEYGADIPFMRPAELASDTAVQLDTIIYNVERLEQEEGIIVDAVALLQPTQPFRTPDDVSGCIQTLLKTGADSAITIAPNKHHPLGIWTQNKDGQGLNQFLNKSDAQAGFNRQQMETLYFRTGAVYVISRKALLEKKSLYGEYVEGYVVDDIRSWINIDDLQDWEMAEAWLAYRTAKGA